MKSILILLVFTLFHLSCSNSKTILIERLDGSKISVADLDTQIQKLVDTANVTGITVSVFNKDTLTYQKAFGYSNYEKKDSLRIDEVFYGASLSKSLFGYLVAHLVEEGVLDLDRPLQHYLDKPLPELHFEKEWRGFKNLQDDSRHEQITARMCLSHTTGFPNWRWINRIGEFHEEGKIQIYSDPGTRYSYSGEGIRLLQIVIQKITGKDLEALARTLVFDPLQMDMSSYVWQKRFEEKYCYGHTADQQVIPKDIEDEPGAAGSMETTATDYSKFLEHILALESQDSPITQLMFEPTIEITSKMQFGPESLETSTENEKIGLNYGMAWGLMTKTPYGKAVFKEGHSDGFQHYSILFPKKDTGVLLMSNSDNAERIFKELLQITIGDSYTSWKWENYIPYNEK
ncbi:serine hydrolase domain-containing protein [Maribacter sp. 2307UL18-2]|uniref:serine hydrolase domain-containing protein n=1 Tax=Maribacter sp. 2307UL18-2 TaxID=3386274 RepID=UPI0039BCA944